MTRLLEIAIEAARQLDPAEQDEIARAIMEIVGASGEGVYVLSEEERAAVERSREFARRGEFVPDEDFEAMLAECRLEIVNATDEGVYVLSEEERAAVEVGRAQADRGEFASEEEVAALLSNRRL